MRLLISFSGIDGSGKTSHAQCVLRILNEQGINAGYVWCGWRRLFSYPFILLVGVLLSVESGKLNLSKIRGDFFDHKTAYLRIKPVRLILPYLVLLDYMLVYLLLIKSRLFLGKVVICDRYVYDWIAKLQSDNIIDERLSDLFIRIFQRPDLSFVLDVTESEAERRKSYEDTINALKRLRTIYLRIAREYDLQILGVNSFKAIHENIMREVGQKILSNGV